MCFCYWLDKGAIKQLVVVLLLHYQTVFGCYQDPPTLGAFFMKNCGVHFSQQSWVPLTAQRLIMKKHPLVIYKILPL